MRDATTSTSALACRKETPDRKEDSNAQVASLKQGHKGGAPPARQHHNNHSVREGEGGGGIFRAKWPEGPEVPVIDPLNSGEGTVVRRSFLIV